MGRGEAGVIEGNISQNFHISRFHGPGVLGQGRADMRRSDNKKQNEMERWLLTTSKLAVREN